MNDGNSAGGGPKAASPPAVVNRRSSYRATNVTQVNENLIFA